MRNRISESALRSINFMIVSFFIIIYLLNHYNISGGLIDGLRELLTIPFMLAEIVFVVMSIKFLIDDSNRETMTIVSMVALAICTVLTIGSFF